MLRAENCILVRRKKIEWIASTFNVSEHARVEMLRRGLTYDRQFLKSAILSSPLAWKSYDDRIVIALTLFRYIVVTIVSENGREYPLVVTFVDTVDSGINVIDRFLLRYQQVNREQEKARTIGYGGTQDE